MRAAATHWVAMNSFRVPGSERNGREMLPAGPQHRFADGNFVQENLCGLNQRVGVKAALHRIGLNEIGNG